MRDAMTKHGDRRKHQHSAAKFYSTDEPAPISVLVTARGCTDREACSDLETWGTICSARKSASAACLLAIWLKDLTTLLPWHTGTAQPSSSLPRQRYLQQCVVPRLRRGRLIPLATASHRRIMRRQKKTCRAARKRDRLRLGPELELEGSGRGGQGLENLYNGRRGGSRS
jgi:hypothetical protein